MSIESVVADVRSRMTRYEPQDEAPYIAMIQAFLDGQTSVDEFETTYLRAFKDDPTNWPENLYRILNEIFLDLDAYYPDPTIRDENGIDETELRARAGVALAALRASDAALAR